ncbi:MAG: hypothetical protein H6Q30_1120 [Bacteroidetes bacterium]|jgi:hypothetical protein|nr:hypothetical protein [Bacteroidota bacterium]
MKFTWCIVLLAAAAVLMLASCQKQADQSAPGKTDQQQTTSAAQPGMVDTLMQSPSANAATQDQTAQQAPLEASGGQSAAPESAGGTLVPLEIKLPKPMFVGTPGNLQVPNLEKPLGAPRPPFLAPEGTKNVASKKQVSSSDEQPIIGELTMVTDGDKEASDGSYVELGPFVQHVTIDLKAKHNVYAILVWHYHKQPRVYFDVVAQVADDPDFVSNVKTVFNNDHDNTAGLGVGKEMNYVETSEGKLIDARGVQGRYVRLYSRGNNANDLNNYVEVEVYGTPVK